MAQVASGDLGDGIRVYLRVLGRELGNIIPT